MFGMFGRILLNLFSFIRKPRLEKTQAMSSLSQLGLPAFLGSFGIISKGSLCLLRWLTGRDDAWGGLISGRSRRGRVRVRY